MTAIFWGGSPKGRESITNSCRLPRRISLPRILNTDQSSLTLNLFVEEIKNSPDTGGERLSEKMKFGFTKKTVTALAVVLIVSAAAASIVVSQITLGNRTAATTLTSNHTTTVTQGVTTTVTQGLTTTTVTQVSTVTSTLISTTTVSAATTTSTTTSALGSGQISVLGQALLAADFTSTGTTTTFTCASAPSSAYLTLTNTGTGSASVASVSITWSGASTGYTLFGSCNFGASGSASATQYVIFPATTLMNPSAITGRPYTGTVTLSSGAQILLSGSWA